ncbi:MAG: DUF721 domain-containing protein [Deltaproteobacteria bacterium]|nr:DUF721 domain-containing protein [Deltaproteobacteria bacterium]
MRNLHLGLRSSRPRLKDPLKLDALLLSSCASLPMTTLIRDYAIKKRWAQFAGDAASAKSEPTRLSGTTLSCNVTSSAWMSELSYAKPEILKKINKAIGEKAVLEIIFKIGEVKGKKPSPPPGLNHRRTPTNAELEKAISISSGVKDDILRNAIKNAFLRSLQ